MIFSIISKNMNVKLKEKSEKLDKDIELVEDVNEKVERIDAINREVDEH